MRWFSTDQSLIYSADYAYESHHFVMGKGSTHEGDVVFFDTDRMGKIYNLYYSPYGVHHDITSMPNGNLLVTGSRGQTIEDFIYEVDIKTGEIVHMLDLKTVLTPIKQREKTFTRMPGTYDELGQESGES